ncbi:hypothetical protein V757_01925 [Pelistega indica]|uniref:Uncharacterized protein n=1 Tax=Pelistega indica TaxID=1414851 RepID=V8G9N4_9BURK|nr:hypothetical protein [Pelistega indica]ETD72821.1 hypothetical protein V757_01925 [Pelistega indica]
MEFDVPGPVIWMVPPDKYPELAWDMAIAGEMDEEAMAQFAARHDLAVEQVHHLLTKEGFTRALTEAKAFIATHGHDKGFKVRARYYAERLADEMYQIARKSSTDPALRLKVFESLTRLAGMEPSSEKKEAVVSSGHGVTINIGAGIRGISIADNTVMIDNERN